MDRDREIPNAKAPKIEKDRNSQASKATRTPDEQYVFLNPDGTKRAFLLVIIAANTSVTYTSQVAGYANEIRDLEGFLIPIAQSEEAERLARFFITEFQGHSKLITWTKQRIEKLKALVAEVVL